MIRGGYKLTTGFGNITAGEYDNVWAPTVRRSGYGVVLLHGAGASQEFVDVTRLHSIRTPSWLGWAGIPMVAGEMGGDTFASDVTMVDDAIDWMGAVMPDLDTSKVHLIGISMGGAVGLRYAIENPSRVASYTGVIPLLNIQSAYTTNYGSLRAQIEAAWGVTYPAALPAGAAIHTGAAALNGVIPSRVYYAGNDTVIDPAVTQAVAATMGATAVDLGTNGHSEASLADWIARGSAGDPGAGLAEQIAFLIANGA